MTWLLPALCYGSTAIFLAGMGWRISVWMRTPVPLKIVLTPAPTTTAGVWRRLAGELFLFRSLFGAERRLWCAAWLLHVSLALLAAGHVGGLVIPGLVQSTLGLSEAQFHRVAQIVGGASGILAVGSLLYLLLRRLTIERLRWISNPSDYFALALLLLIVVTGNHMRFIGGLELAQARQFVSGLLTAQPVAPPASPAFTAHLLLVCALLAYIPFSKLLHLGALVFSPTLNQRNNPRERRYT